MPDQPAQGKQVFSKANRPYIRKVPHAHAEFWAFTPDAITPEEMGMADHWLKGFVRENLRKGMSPEKAQEAAVKKVKNLLWRNKMGLTNNGMPRNPTIRQREKTSEDAILEKFGY